MFNTVCLNVNFPFSLLPLVMRHNESIYNESLQANSSDATTDNDNSRISIPRIKKRQAYYPSYGNGYSGSGSENGYSGSGSGNGNGYSGYGSYNNYNGYYGGKRYNYDNYNRWNGWYGGGKTRPEGTQLNY